MWEAKLEGKNIISVFLWIFFMIFEFLIELLEFVKNFNILHRYSITCLIV